MFAIYDNQIIENLSKENTDKKKDLSSLNIYNISLVETLKSIYETTGDEFPCNDGEVSDIVINEK